ncbi:DUF4387 domain-containing protein [Falsiroseomonas oryziterrae]|uniref:DUF4387 domain-containing protein n=1 Tax=Falsiroseomonas oryziterrae TaxID=2911368 RepID=UPI001F3E500E|nr:DUF4387 domain-containing protein [Roseomonas sp. NPKOSM-4]
MLRNMPTLRDLATTIRSKNAGVDHITFDLIFRERANFERVRDSGVLSRAKVAALYGIPEERVTDFVVFEPANAIKFTIRRARPSGSPGESDVFGAQQYAPLFAIEVP